MYRNDGGVTFDCRKSSSNLVLKKGVFFLSKFHFYIKRSKVISGKGLLHFHQETYHS